MLKLKEVRIIISLLISNPLGLHHFCHSQYRKSWVKLDLFINYFKLDPIVFKFACRINLCLKLSYWVQIQPLLKVINYKIIQLFKLILALVNHQLLCITHDFFLHFGDPISLNEYDVCLFFNFEVLLFHVVIQLLQYFVELSAFLIIYIFLI